MSDGGTYRERLRRQRREARGGNVLRVVLRRRLVTAPLVLGQCGLQGRAAAEPVGNRLGQELDIAQRIADSQGEERILMQAGIAGQRPPGAVGLAVEVREVRCTVEPLGTAAGADTLAES